MDSNYCTIEELINRIEKRPKMFVHEVRLDYIYYLLAGYIGCAVQTKFIEKKDIYFREKFFVWLKKWAEINFNKDYSGKPILWYDIIEDNTSSNEDAVAKFYALSKQFFVEYQEEEIEVDRG